MNHLENAERLFVPVTPAAPAISEYEKRRLALLATLHRLRAERLARSTPRSGYSGLTGFRNRFIVNWIFADCKCRPSRSWSDSGPSDTAQSIPGPACTRPIFRG
jgi:hypothetical protein